MNYKDLKTTELFDAVNDKTLNDDEKMKIMDVLCYRFPVDWLDDKLNEYDKQIKKLTDKVTRYGDVVDLIGKMDRIIQNQEKNLEKIRKESYQKGYQKAKKKYQI